MKYFAWDAEKNEQLRAERGDILDILEHPNQEKYRGQRIFVVNVSDYAYLVPFEETESEVVLKTIIPSRKATRRYLRGEAGNA